MPSPGLKNWGGGGGVGGVGGGVGGGGRMGTKYFSQHVITKTYLI